MSRHYFPSVLDNFEKQSLPSEQSVVSSNHIELVTNAITVQQADPKY